MNSKGASEHATARASAAERLPQAQAMRQTGGRDIGCKWRSAALNQALSSTDSCQAIAGPMCLPESTGKQQQHAHSSAAPLLWLLCLLAVSSVSPSSYCLLWLWSAANCSSSCTAVSEPEEPASSSESSAEESAAAGPAGAPQLLITSSGSPACCPEV